MKILIAAYIMSAFVTTGSSINAHNNGCIEGGPIAKFAPAINNNYIHASYKAGQTIGLSYSMNLWSKKFKNEGKNDLAPKLAIAGAIAVNIMDSRHNFRVECN